MSQWRRSTTLRYVTKVMHMKIIAMIFLSFIFAPPTLASDSTYDAVVAGKKCQEDKNQSLSCSYTVGKSLLIEIAGIRIT